MFDRVSRPWRPLAPICATVLGVLLVSAAPASAFDPGVEAQNYNKGQERQTIYDTPQYQTLLAQISSQNEAAAVALQAADPERNFHGHLCARGDNGCAGDVRLYDWLAKGYGIVAPVLFTARSGATISGHVWATRAGPAKRAAIVITNGSVQADEQLYWYAAQALAKAGYVVLTSDPQGQGQSDEQGEAPDQSEGSPAQSDGRPFFDGTEDAINFMLSNPSHPYEPVPSCSTGTSHAPKQDRRVKAGLDATYNPFWQLVDASRVGLAGHSFGALGVSYIGQWDPRVKAIVAWDNLAKPDPNQPTGASFGNPEEKPCPARPANRTPAPVTKPALAMSADYFIPPEPNTSDPNPLGKSTESLAYTKAGVDTGELIIRGGTHYDFDWIPNQGFAASLRGADMIAWYTTAWFDKYVNGDPTADSRLLTNRWRTDGQEAAIDQPNHDGNMFSFYYRSRLDIHLSNGGSFDCEDMRPGCPGLLAADGYQGDYSFIAVDTRPDGQAASPTPNTLPRAGGIYSASTQACLSTTPRVVRLRHKHARIVRASVFVDGRRAKVVRGHALHRVTVPPLTPGRHRVKVVGQTSGGRRYATRRTYYGCATARPRRLGGLRRHR
jgi:dienelactone hydrolase